MNERINTMIKANQLTYMNKLYTINNMIWELTEKFDDVSFADIIVDLIQMQDKVYLPKEQKEYIIEDIQKIIKYEESEE